MAGVVTGGLAVVSLESLGGVFFAQSFVRQPLDGPDPCLGITCPSLRRAG
jgi:hypothetical protein